MTVARLIEVLQSFDCPEGIVRIPCPETGEDHPITGYVYGPEPTPVKCRPVKFYVDLMNDYIDESPEERLRNLGHE